MKKLILFGAFLLLYNFQYAQNEGPNIQFTIDEYDQDFVTIGFYYGDRQLVLDTITKNENGAFHLKQDEALKEGIYLLLLSPDNQYIQFAINDKDQQFDMKMNVNSLSNPEINGSLDNEQFYTYLKFLGEKGKQNQAIMEQMNVPEIDSMVLENLRKEQNNINLEVLSYQKQLISKYPDLMTSRLIKSSMDIEMPEFTGSNEEIQTKRYYYYMEHYFDNVHLEDPASLRMPFINNKVDSYVNQITPQIPDSINKSLDFVLNKMKPASETYKFYLSYFLNYYAKSKIVGFDAVYVHLVDNYYAKGEADWIEQENLQQLIEQANKIRPTLLGKQAQDIKVFQRDGSAISMSDINSEYLILYFWAPDCGHCSKATPHVIEYYNKVKDSLDLEILAVCTKHREKEKTCWEGVDEKGMDLWINASDINHTSGFRFKYNVETTPQIYILDRDRKIIMKRIGADKLDDVMSEIIRLQDEKAMEEQMNKD